MNKKTLSYILVMGMFAIMLFLILNQGHHLESGKLYSHPQTTQNLFSFNGLLNTLTENLSHPFAKLLLQILIIILITRLFGWLMIYIGQSSVIGEILAGIALGPSLMGMFFPGFSGFLFPPDSLKTLQLLSQIGLILFMFIVGMETELNVLRKKAYDAVVISHTSIIFPYFLGVGLAYFLYNNFAQPNTSFLAFALFMGIAMSITAFPVLARIVQERGMTKTTLGSLVITCAAADDVTAWCILAVVIAIVKAGAIMGAMLNISLSILYVLFMLYIIKPLLNKVAENYYSKETISKVIVTIMFAVLLLSSYLTELIGIHALFGAFMAGAVVPSRSKFRMVLSGKIEDLSLVLLMPLFFTFTGLRTQIGLLNDFHLWTICFYVIGVAVAGKFLGSALAAKFVGNTWNDSIIIGALMNTRGLMELIVLNIGYELGILSTEIFTMLVIMSLLTTFMTTPVLNLLNYFKKKRSEKEDEITPHDRYNILVSFGSSATGGRLLELIHQLNLRNGHQLYINALHLTPRTDISLEEAKHFEYEGFKPILKTAKSLNMKVNPIYKTTNDTTKEIIQQAGEGGYHLMLVGTARTPFSSFETGGRVKYFFEEAKCPVGVLVDKGFMEIDKVLLLINEFSDQYLTRYAQRILEKPSKHITILDNNRLLLNDETYWGMSPDHNHYQVNRIEDTILDKHFMNRFDLIIMSLTCWNQVRQDNLGWLHHSPSILIINNK